MNTDALQEKLPILYIALVFILAVPFWLIGGNPLPLPINLPASALATFVPAIAASVLSYRQFGPDGVKELIEKAWDYRKIRNKVWLLPALFLAPLIYLLSYAVMRLTGLPLPDSIKIPLRAAPAFFMMFLIGDAGEELGWSGYAIEPMQKRWGPAKAGFILGLVWAIWHWVGFVQTRRPARWIIWQSLKTVATRMVIVWIYNKSGKSVFAANLYHATDNLSWSLFPNYGSHYDSSVTALLTWLVAVLVLLGWGPKPLGRDRPLRVSR